MSGGDGLEGGRAGAEKNHPEEKIVLDAEVTGVVDIRAFRARLGNGHELIAFVPRERPPASGGVCTPGGRVRVRVSSFDMSRGEIVEISKKASEIEHES